MSATEEAEALKLLFRNQYSFLISKIMFTASDLGVFDLLMESKEPLTSVTIAERLGTSPFGMERLLDACVGLKFLQVERKDNQTLYGNTNLANLYLGKRSPRTQYYSLKFNVEFVYTRAQHLADSVREGEAQTYRLSDISTKDVFEAMYRSESGLREFMEFMHEMWSLCGRDVLSAFDLSHFPLVCDLGGCTGDLAKEYISLYPNSTVTILDLPEVVETGKKHFVSSEEHRITFHEGDAFKDPIPEADLYIVARTLHCFSEEKCVQLLTRLHKACKPGGGVLVVEIVLNEDRTGPFEAHIYAVVMLLLTQGKERTPSEYNALLSAAGFKDIQQKKAILFDAILGRK
ncbi:acetylserotonin O-methyltransferase-like [Lacerta agilis]|uniref:acetylserotonin O-methyltransferase-like n=1 Tax=Lacerta agilis TaxID=80427 RepID=UPI0014191464|nr:acetylserotonin O-methyltransferase-like [Lacerta agilis]XP_033003501.1 acetylserotonin O-methyltransferase-like [Lacerta agilis]